MTDNEPQPCPDCNGSGQVYNWIDNVSITCPTCEGTGEQQPEE